MLLSMASLRGSSLLGLSLISGINSIFVSWPKHKKSSPLHEIRTRLQFSQKLWLCGEINPTFVCVFFIQKYSAGPLVDISVFDNKYLLVLIS